MGQRASPAQASVLPRCPIRTPIQDSSAIAARRGPRLRQHRRPIASSAMKVRAASLLAIAAFAVPAAPEAHAKLNPANRCVALQFGSGRAGTFFFKPTALGRYLLGDTRGKALAEAANGATAHADAPSAATEWRRAHGGLQAVASGHFLALKGGALVTHPSVAKGGLRAAHGCKAWPEAQLGARGKPFMGKRKDGTVFGFADAHFHPTADMRAGGQTISGEGFDRFGITEALGHDADVHGPTGSEDFTGNLLRGDDPAAPHDTHGWPTFVGWPTYDTYTHQQVYYRWLQRAWMAGMRLAVAQVVEDTPLCNIEPKKSHDCDETNTVVLEVKRLRAMQDYIDAQAGGRGR